MAAMLYSLIRVVLDAIATSHSNEAKLRAEVLALRRQVQVLERQIKRVRWEPGDRMILAALRERLHPATRRCGGCGLYCRTEFGLGDPAGSQSELEAKRRRYQRSGRGSRPRSQVRQRL